ncbi:sensor histidine kinase [Shewanella sp. NIFS-20-20]|uniref:sensor histidine kinase n=1 Tax=Shewanella sp. NIFS-20-20 TaxID=2853806 RepID=UPI001C491C8D|nr:HAMP domain-containing sensor histidine kinase [Shewanella sp. NIFS-20-20]MBV7314623.1 HAMP domain-containing histidine kinase [Shewanella sp. NIFS-20-20]
MPIRLFYHLALLLIAEMVAALAWLWFDWPADTLLLVFLVLVSGQYLLMRNQVKITQQVATPPPLAEAQTQAPLPELIAKAVHEMNTPLGSSLITVTHCQDSLTLLEQGLTNDQLSYEELREYIDNNKETLNILHSNLLRLNSLIKDFYTVSHQYQLQLIERIHIATELAQIVNDLTPQIGQHQVSIDCPEDIWFSVNPTIFYQVVNNLIVNAARHAFDEQTSGQINVQVRLTDLQQLTLTCQDNGIGMTEDIRSQIFKPFFTTKKVSGGTGLGLAIVQGALLSIHGRIRCESQPSQGSRFTIEIDSPDNHQRDLHLVRKQVS